MAAINIKTSSKVTPQCYAYTTPGVPAHDGWTKIGFTERDVETRIKEQTHTVGVEPKLCWHMRAAFMTEPYGTFTDKDFHAYLKKLEEKKPVVFCGDLNVAHKEIDLKNPKTNRKNAGFTDEEREKFTRLLDAGFIDTWRYFNPDLEGVYSWWSYRFSARQKNAGWRIDYFCVSDSLKDRLVSAAIHTDVLGSDHCPVEVVIGD